MAVILGEEAERATWPQNFIGRLREWGIELESFSSGPWMVSTYGHGGLAGAEFLNAEEGRYAGEVWASQFPCSPCPFLADLSIIGFVEWKPWHDEPYPRGEWLAALVKEGKGLIAERCTRRCRRVDVHLS